MLVAPYTLAMALLASCGLLDPTPELPKLDDPCAEWTAPGLYRLPVTAGGSSRNPYVFVPSLEAGPRPALTMLHGAGGSANRIMDRTDLRAAAREHGFVAVFPNGSGGLGGLTWNAGGCCGFAAEWNIDDEAFLTALRQTVAERLCTDRMVMVGHSNGGMMAARHTCSGAFTDATITSAGPLLLERCEGPPSPFMAWHGLDDDIVPYAGSTTDGVVFPPAEQAFDKIRARNACSDSPPTKVEYGDVTCSTWDCEAPTTRCTVSDWSHKWPGIPSDRPPEQSIETFILSFAELAAPTPTDDPRDTDGPKDTSPDTEP